MMPKDIRKLLQAIEEEITSRTEMNLKDMLNSPSSYVRARAIKSASDREIIIEDLEAFLEDPSPEVRRSVITSMSRSGIGQDKILLSLEDPSDTVRSAAVKELIEFGYEDGDLARRVASDPSKKVRKTFVLSLLESGETELLKEFDNDPSNDIQIILSAYRGELELDEERLSALPKRLQKMAFASRMTQRNAQAMSALLESLSKYRSASIKESIIDLISAFPEEIAVPALKKLLDSDDKYISLPSLKVFRKIKGYDSQLLGLAERLMNSEDEECRFYGAQYLKGLQEPSSVEILHQGLEDPSDRVRALSLEALGNLLDHSIENVVEESLRSTSSRLKKGSLRAVKKLRLFNCGDLISRLLKNKKEEAAVRMLAASVTGFLKLEDLAGDLESVIVDLSNDGRLRLAASRAMARINPSRLGELFGFTEG